MSNLCLIWQLFTELEVRSKRQLIDSKNCGSAVYYHLCHEGCDEYVHCIMYTEINRTLCEMSYTCPILITDVFIFFVFLMYKAKHQISLNYKASLFTINIDLMFT